MYQWSALFSAHIQHLQTHFEHLIEQSDADGVMIHSGSVITRFLDDQNYEFWPNPRFCQWVPERAMADSVLIIQPGVKPLLLWHQPVDYWHAVADAPSGFWVDAFDIHIITESDQILSLLPKGVMIGLGSDEARLRAWGVKACNPKQMTDALDWYRGIKTEYEQVCIQAANHRAVKGHLAAEKAFRAGESELSIHLQYLAAVQQKESHMPYGNIVALNDHGSILHYDNYQTQPVEARSFLIDAGATHHHYSADITRTYAREAGVFKELISRVDQEVHTIIQQVKPSVHYASLHDQMHRSIASILSDTTIVNVSAEAAYEKGYTRTFFPHGLGHLLGLVVHDAGGKLANQQGETAVADSRYPALRCLRSLEEGMVLTIEPGLYFIPQLLDAHKGNTDFNWSLIDMLKPLGGIRVEDNIAVTQGEAVNFTRNAFNEALNS